MEDTAVPVVSSAEEHARLLILTSSENVYTNPDGLSNAEKLEIMRTVFNCPKCDIFSPFPYAEVLDKGGAEAFGGGYHLSDLRIQTLDRLIADSSGDTVEHLKRRLANLAWKVKYREAVNMHNMTVSINDGKIPTH